MTRTERRLFIYNNPFRAVGTGGAQGHVPPQYLEQPVVVPLQYFQQIWGLTNWVPPQYLAPSYSPDLFITNIL